MSNSKKNLTKPCCRNCAHYILGYSLTTQIEPVYVCDNHEKRIYRGDYNGVRGRVYHYTTRPMFVCGDFKQREDDDSK